MLGISERLYFWVLEGAPDVNGLMFNDCVFQSVGIKPVLLTGILRNFKIAASSCAFVYPQEWTPSFLHLHSIHWQLFKPSLCKNLLFSLSFHHYLQQPCKFWNRELSFLSKLFLLLNNRVNLFLSVLALSMGCKSAVIIFLIMSALYSKLGNISL